MNITTLVFGSAARLGIRRKGAAAPLSTCLRFSLAIHLSEGQAQSELELTFRRHQGADDSSDRRPNCERRDVELWRIRQIEKLPAELQPEALGDRKCPRHSEIEIKLPRPAQDSPAGIAKNK